MAANITLKENYKFYDNVTTTDETDVGTLLSALIAIACVAICSQVI